MTINTQPLTAPNEGSWLDQAVEAARYAFNHTPLPRDWKELGKSEAYETSARIAEGIES